MGKLNNRVAIVTGSASGIGRATALLFAGEGARLVVVTAHSLKAGKETVEMIKAAGGEAIFIKADVSRSKDVQNMIKDTLLNYGKLDILHNNAAIDRNPAPTAGYQERDWDEIINTNLKGVFMGMKYAIPEMIKRGGGVIINTGSGIGMVGACNAPAYCASKGGVLTLTKAAALEYAAHNIRVNCLVSGPTETPMLKQFTGGRKEAVKKILDKIPLGRLGRPEEIAQAALFLASDQSSFVTGSALVVDGGYTAH